MLKKNWEEVNTSLLNLGDLRLDASYYCEASKSHLKLINYKGKKENCGVNQGNYIGLEYIV